MAKTVILDEIHVTIRVPKDLPDAKAEAARRALAGDDFTTRLRRAVRAVVRLWPELAAATVAVTR